MLGLLAAAIGVLALPASASAQATGSDCSYTDVNGGVVGVEAGGTGMTGAAGTTAVGACVNLPTPAGTFQGGSGEIGVRGTQAYAVIDGDNQNADPGDGYMGLSNFETGTAGGQTTAAECSASGPDNGEAATSNSGGCFGVDGLAWVALPRAVPTPICGNTSGNSWFSTARDGCSNP
jgi:hypothetical protein